MKIYETLILRGYDEVTKKRISSIQLDADVSLAVERGWKIKSSSGDVIYLQKELQSSSSGVFLSNILSSGRLKKITKLILYLPFSYLLLCAFWWGIRLIFWLMFLGFVWGAGIPHWSWIGFI
jgi:hypothetical protein